MSTLTQIKLAWRSVRVWVLLGILLGIYLLGRHHGSEAVRVDIQKEYNEKLEDALNNAREQAEKDASDARQEAVIAQALADERAEQQRAAQERVRGLEKALRSVPGPEVCRLPDGAVEVLERSLRGAE